MYRWVLGLLLVSSLLLGMAAPVHAQEPAPTPTPTMEPTPTPSYMVAVPMSTGSSLLVQKSVTFGDIAVTVSVLILATIELGKGFMTIPKLWWKNGR